ncbi:MAG: hypothetical protein ABF291_00885, partial [Desulfobacterales bacterium]
ELLFVCANINIYLLKPFAHIEDFLDFFKKRVYFSTNFFQPIFWIRLFKKTWESPLSRGIGDHAVEFVEVADGVIVDGGVLGFQALPALRKGLLRKTVLRRANE